MASLQERLHIKPLDKWSTREQLALASAVSCSGDQNWMSVSRTLKLICGNNARPADWFSQKNCAVQYGHLLENVETPKRKKRSSESSGMSSALPMIETPTSDDLILRRLTEERIRELKNDIRKEQEEYAKVLDELKLLQWGKLSDEQIIEMWREIEKQQEAQRIEEMKLENQMREREQRKLEMQRSWRPNTVVAEVPKVETNVNSVDMDVEEILPPTKPAISNVGNAVTNQPARVQTGTSPLLSSLLKSPTATNNMTTLAPETPSSIPPRSAAPTITTLLTGGSIPNSNQPLITLTSFIPATEAEHLLTRPISSLPTDGVSTVLATTQSVLSPSRSAPTLSMLLEKTKAASVANAASKNLDTRIEGPPSEANASQKTEVKTSRSDSINEEVPMDIEEDVPQQTNAANSNTTQNIESDEPDPNEEEQQLLEVFKNIGNIDDIDVDIDVSDVIDDEAVDFLKDVDEATDQTESESKFGPSEKIANANNTVEETKVENGSDVKKDAVVDDASPAEDVDVKSDNLNAIISSDDSNDDIPLSAVASLENRERSSFLETSQDVTFLKGKVESAIKSVDTDTKSVSYGEPAEVEVTDIQSETTVENPGSVEENETKVIFLSPNDGQKQLSNANEVTKEAKTDYSSTIVREDEPSVTKKIASDEKVKDEVTKKSADTKAGELKVPSDDMAIEASTPEQVERLSMADEDIKATPPPIVAISIADTDEDSSATDVSVSTRKDDKLSASTKQSSSKRRSYQDPSRDEQKPDDEFVTVSATPVRPPLLRKLRDRDRSESPMIEDDITSELPTNLRSRQRCSSTPVIDSIPNSPASSDRDDRETRASKKTLNSIYNALHPNKNAALFQSIFLSDQTKTNKVCLRPMDFATIKKNIDSGVTRNVIDLQRDVMLMCHNALMLCKMNSSNYKAVVAYMQDLQSVKGFIQNPYTIKTERESRERKSSSNTSTKVRSRKSQRNL